MTDHTLDNIKHTYIAPSPIHGQGLFSEAFIQAGKRLAILDGQVIPWSLHREIGFVDEWNAIAPGYILVRPYRTKYAFINHSREPNIAIERLSSISLALRTTRSIPKDQELTLDYREEPLPEDYLAGHGASFL